VTGRSYPSPHFSLTLVGLCRFRVEEITQEHPYVVARVTQLDYLTSTTVGLTVGLKTAANVSVLCQLRFDTELP